MDKCIKIYFANYFFRNLEKTKKKQNYLKVREIPRRGVNSG